jgi:hypothetical protein
VSTAYFSGLCEASRSKYAPLYATPPSRNDTIRECAAKAKTWLEDWGIDLQATCDAYIDAANNGLFNGRRIDPVLAKASAKQFKERADSVYDCGEQLSKVLRALLTDEVKP